MSFNSKKLYFQKINFFLKKIKYENKVLVILKGPSQEKIFFQKKKVTY